MVGGVVASAHATSPQRSIFSYDRSRPLAFVDRGRVNRNYPIAVDDVSYTAGKDRINAYLVRPQKPHGRLPAVVYLHGAQGDRTELLVQSTWLAARGAIAVVITAPSTASQEPAGLKGVPFLRWEQQIQARDVVAIRRAVDVLAARKDVDPARIGFVGWSSGSHTGGILAGVEPRLRALVLMSGGVAPVSVYTALARPDQRASIRKYLGSIDPLRFLPKARPGSLFLQDGRQDTIVPRKALLTFAHAAPKGTRLTWYAAGHGLNDAAYRDQLNWLVAKLRIAGPRVPGAATGP
ncbi:MAG TPA: acetylxylan esterase [Gaiellaceae bacterium]|nr:acetylxylan esterase [Gaiellaceae bacterium]